MTMKPYDAIPSPDELKRRPRLPTFRSDTVDNLVRWAKDQTPHARSWMFVRMLDYHKAGFPVNHTTEAMAALDLLQWRTGTKTMKAAVGQLQEWDAIQAMAE